jgi:hypothetical protein
VDEFPMEKLERMATFLRLESMETHWRHEDNQDLYIGVAQKFRRDRGQKCEAPEDEEENILLEAKQLALKDAIKRRPGDARQQRASDMHERGGITPKGFGKKPE